MLAKQLLNHRYQLLERLAENAGQQTWLAIDRENESHDYVVVKLLAMNPQMQWEHAKLLEREAQILGKLDHPYIPKYRDYFMLDQVSGSRFSWLCLVQNQVPGKSLQQLLDQGYRFTQVEVEAIASEVLSILSYLHSFNPPILHRDIKPSNLMRGEGHIYLIDFGAVQEQAALEGVTFTVIGTYGYVPMEQFSGRAVPSSDLYALGASLIHLLTGVSPADLPQVNGRIEFASSVGIDPALVNWIRKLTEPNVDDRLPTADRALDALRNRSSLNLSLLKRKPTGSKIQLQKSINRLDITIPCRNRHALNLYTVHGKISTAVTQRPQNHDRTPSVLPQLGPPQRQPLLHEARNLPAHG
jgi:serine/threonine protein kinase